MNFAQIILSCGAGIATAIGVSLLYHVACGRARVSVDTAHVPTPYRPVQEYKRLTTIEYRTRGYDSPELAQTDLDRRRDSDTLQ